MSAPALPLTVVSGYLGAGKTTLINRLLTEDHGLRLMVLVNDFGAINIDAALLQSQGSDTIALTNGCVCCTKGADLFMALADALDRRPRPDHLIVEASGISDPARIADTARAEPDLLYSGIVTMVDLDAFPGLIADDLIAPQVGQQIACADLVLTRGADGAAAADLARLTALTAAEICPVERFGALAPLVLGLDAAAPVSPAGHLHPDYLAWHVSDGTVTDKATLDRLLANRPPGLYRLKGTVRTDRDGAWRVQVVGPRVVVRRADDDATTQLVGLGMAARLDRDETNAWWSDRNRA